MKKPISTLVTKPLVTLLLAITYLVYPSTVGAQNNPLGGPVLSVIDCTCTLGLVSAVTIGPPVGGVFAFIFGTQLYMYKTFPQATYGLGLWTNGGSECWIGVEPECVLVPTQGVISPTLGNSK